MLIFVKATLWTIGLGGCNPLSSWLDLGYPAQQ